MATPSLAELFTPQTGPSIEASVRSIARAVGLPEGSWPASSIGVELVSILSELIANSNSVPSTRAAAAGLLDFASGDWLKLAGEQRFATPFVGATFGSCSCQLTNTVATPQTWATDDLRALNALSGATYLNTTGGTLPGWRGAPHPYPTVDLAFQAETAGSAASSAAGQISELASPLAGVLITNTTPAVGTDALAEPAYKALCRESIASRSANGPVDAYNYFAKTTLRGDGTNAGVTRTKIDQPRSAPGTLTVYLASDAGPVAPDDTALVLANLLANAQPHGITPGAASAEPHAVPVSATLFLARGSTVDPESVRAAALASLLAFFRELPIGGTVIVNGDSGYVFREMVVAALASGSDQIVQVELTNLNQDVPLAPNEVAVCTSSLADMTTRST